MVRQLCQDLRFRVAAVDAAVATGMHQRPQPDRLPDNIYATTGDWARYATPSRDARLKTSFKELRDETLRLAALASSGSPAIAYRGTNLRGDLLAVYETETRACPITYRRSDGRLQTLPFEEVRRRLFALSFDPHHCPERRWGATDPEELASCHDGETKWQWYEAQQSLRNQLELTYGLAMRWSLDELRRGGPLVGVAEPPHVDLLKFLKMELAWQQPSLSDR